MQGHHGTNLKKHLLRIHNFEEENFKTVTVSSTSTSDSASKSTQLTINEMNTIKIEISKQILIDACVELVTVNGRPFTLMEDSGFKKILDPIKRGILKKTKEDFSLTAESIQKYISKEASALRQQIINEVKNTMVSVKIDGVSRLDRSFLGINIQYVRNGKIVLRTLALKELASQHTGMNLKNVILDVLSNFQIQCDQIYTITKYG